MSAKFKIQYSYLQFTNTYILFTSVAFCVYYGVLYKQGQTWDQGCQKKCRCDDATNNYYTCFDR